MLYHAIGKRYLYPAPPNDATISESDLAGLVVPADIAARVQAKRWQKLGIEPLPVLEAPTDGLGQLPYWGTS